MIICQSCVLWSSSLSLALPGLRKTCLWLVEFLQSAGCRLGSNWPAKYGSLYSLRLNDANVSSKTNLASFTRPTLDYIPNGMRLGTFLVAQVPADVSVRVCSRALSVPAHMLMKIVGGEDSFIMMHYAPTLTKKIHKRIYIL